MIPFIALSLAVLTSDAAVTGLSVQPAADRTEIVIGIDGAVTASHFTLENPNRIVIDLAGLGQIKASQYAIERGGVLRLRVGQFDEQTVRIVVDLSGTVEYRLDQSDGSVRVSFHNPEGEFSAWRSDEFAPTPAMPVTAPERQPAANASTRFSEPVRAPATVLPVQQQARAVTVTFSEEPVSNVLSTFAEFADRSIIASASVKTKMITSEVRSQTWDIALEAILAANNLY
jgi:N-acetylmuramoyl-L-alanine amidase